MGGLLYRENIPHAGQPTRQREPTQGLAREIGQGLFIFPVNTAYLDGFSVRPCGEADSVDGTFTKGVSSMEMPQIFENKEFGKIRVVEHSGAPWFVGKDVADILGYQNSSRDINRHVAEEDRQNYQNGTFESPRGMTIINESGLYALIFGSKLESAQRFKHWVTAEVLPAIRKTGGYQAPQGKELLALAVLEAQKTIEEQNKAIEQMKPKVIFANAVETSHTSILIGDLAKLLKQNGVDIGQKRLFDWMRKKGYLIKRKGSDWNMPTQKAMDMKVFEVKESTVNNPDGSVRINRTTKVTGKGQTYFVNKFLDSRDNRDRDPEDVRI